MAEVRYQDLMNLLRFLYEGEIRLSHRRGAVLQKWLRVIGVRCSITKTPMPSDPSLGDSGDNEEVRTCGLS